MNQPSITITAAPRSHTPDAGTTPLDIKSTPQPEQWMIDAATEYFPNISMKSHGSLCRIIAEHYAAHLASKPSIWRPVSEARIDGRPSYWNTGMTHWFYESDLLALAPLPKAKTREELDEEWADRYNGTIHTRADLLAAIAFGRSTAGKDAP